jgi:archaellum component FlaC
MSRMFYDFLAIANVGFWGICFWWMHRISARQNAVLDQLRQQAHRIENISKEEHAILSELHPNVESIQKSVDEVSDEVTRVKGKIEEQR